MADWPIRKHSWRLFGKLAFNTNHNGYEAGGGELDVRHAPASQDRRWHVRISSGDGPNAVVYGRGDGKTYVRDSAEVQPAIEVKPPSEAILSLVSQHHLHPDQWPVLLDALQEHYPELWDAVEAHRTARRNGDATLYARAFAAVVA